MGIQPSSSQSGRLEAYMLLLMSSSELPVRAAELLDTYALHMASHRAARCLHRSISCGRASCHERRYGAFVSHSTSGSTAFIQLRVDGSYRFDNTVQLVNLIHGVH